MIQVSNNFKGKARTNKGAGTLLHVLHVRGALENKPNCLSICRTLHFGDLTAKQQMLLDI
jgi:hypothetical protein